MQGPESEEVEPVQWWAYVLVGVAWFGVMFALGAGGYDSEPIELGVAGTGIGLLGVLCWRNGQQCGALHCRISGPAYVLLALYAYAGALFAPLPAESGIIMYVFLGIAATAYGLEHLLDSKQDPQTPEAPG